MKQNPIEDVMNELLFTEAERKGFMKFLTCAKTCQETGNNNDLKQNLEQLIADVVKN